MIISVFPNLNNKGVSVLAVNVVNKLISGGAEVYLSEEHEAVFAKTKAKFETFDKAMSICDCAIAIGGDGTTLNIAKKAAFGQTGTRYQCRQAGLYEWYRER